MMFGMGDTSNSPVTLLAPTLGSNLLWFVAAFGVAYLLTKKPKREVASTQ